MSSVDYGSAILRKHTKPLKLSEMEKNGASTVSHSLSYDKAVCS